MSFPQASYVIVGNRAVATVVVFMALFQATLAYTATPGNLPPDWQAGRLEPNGQLIPAHTVEYESGIWDIKTEPSENLLVWKRLSGDSSVVEQILDATGQQNALVGITMRSSLSASAGGVWLVTGLQGQKLTLYWDEEKPQVSIPENSIEVEGVGFPVWLKLSKSGGYFSAYYSRDGKEWRPVGVPIRTFWGEKRPEVFAGIESFYFSEQRVSNLDASPTENPIGPEQLPEGWNAYIGGLPEYVGEAKYLNGNWLLSGANARGRFTGPHGVSVLRPVSERIQMSAQIRTVSLVDQQSAGGLVLEGPAVAAEIMSLPAAGNMWFVAYRKDVGQTLYDRRVPIPPTMAGQPEMFLRLDLVNGHVAAFASSDGKEWTKVGDTVTLPGLATGVSGGMKLWSQSASRSVSEVSFRNFQTRPISALPESSPMSSAVAVPPPPRPAAGGSSSSSGWVVIAVIVAVILFFVIRKIARPPISAYNNLVFLRNQTQNAWAQIDVQLKRRHDLILNIVEAVKGYARHERETLEGVTQARALAVLAKTVPERTEAENALTATMRTLYTVVEAYPDLKANQSFLDLQRNLTSTEDALAAKRHVYNDAVLAYNTQIQSFPTNLMAWAFHFTKRDYFQLKEEGDRETQITDL